MAIQDTLWLHITIVVKLQGTVYGEDTIPLLVYGDPHDIVTDNSDDYTFDTPLNNLHPEHKPYHACILLEVILKGLG